MGDINTWGLDVFSLKDILEDERVLTCVTFNIFKERDLLATLKIDEKTLLSFLMSLESHYNADIKYHNALHAADVTQSVHHLLSSPGLSACSLSSLEVVAAVLAAAVHDVDHPGLTNSFLVNTSQFFFDFKT